jgi:hypothetical protein
MKAKGEPGGSPSCSVERVIGFEPIPEAWKAAVLPLHHTRTMRCCRAGRGGGIRTPDTLVPNQVRYQAALRPEPW